MYNWNWNEKIESCKTLINNWNKRKLTYFGKNTVIKTLLLPKFVYLAQNISTPKDVINTINSIIFKFLWNNSRDKIKRTTTIGNKLEGDLEVPDFTLLSNTQNIKLVKSLIMSNSANWKNVPNFFLDKYGKDSLIFKMNLDSSKSIPKTKLKLPEFYQNLLDIWINFRNRTEPPFEKKLIIIKNQIIWGNKYLKINNKTLFLKHWIDAKNNNFYK